MTRWKPITSVIEERRSMPRPRALPVLITVDPDGTAIAVYALPESDREEEQPLFRFETLEALLREHDLEQHEIEEV